MESGGVSIRLAFGALRIMKRIFCLLFSAMMLFSTVTNASEDRLVIRAGDDSSPKIALTFDDGPHPKRTDEILDLLEEYDIRATFFVIGQNAVYYPEPLRRAVSLGHEIGNHTFCHSGTSAMSEIRFTKELRDTGKVISELTGASLSLFRPPEGACTNAILDAAEKEGYSVILWTVDTRDWELASTESIVKTVQKNIRGGSILLFHDYTPPEAHTVDALKILIPSLLEKGYEFVTVSELISEK